MDNFISKQRLDYIDVFRSLGIIAMVMGHVGFGGRGRKIFCVYGEKSSLIRTRYV